MGINMKDVWRKVTGFLVLATLVLSGPAQAMAIDVSSSSLEFVFGEEASYLPSEEVSLKAVSGTNFSSESSVSVSLSSANGGEFSGGALSGSCDADFAGTGSITISTGTTQKAFCYRNANIGSDTITAVFTQGDLTETVTLDITIAAGPVDPAISLTLFSDLFPANENLEYEGLVTTEEGGARYAHVEIYSGFSCEGGLYNSELIELLDGDVVDNDYLYSGLAGSFSTGDYSIVAHLVDQVDEVIEIYASSECLDFTVTEEEYVPEGTLTVAKVVDENYYDMWSFDFTGDAGDFYLSNYSDTDEGSVTARTMNVSAGDVVITELTPEDWTMTDVVCDYEGYETSAFVSESEGPLVEFNSETNSFTVAVGEEESVYCTVYNEYTPLPTGYLIIEKEVQNYESEEPWSFNFWGIGEGFTLSEDSYDEESFEKRKSPDIIYAEVSAGPVTITEEEQRNWQMSDVTCEYENIYARIDEDTEVLITTPLVSFDDNNQTFVVDVPEDTTVRCVVTNTFEEESKSSGTKVGVKRNSLPKAPSAPTVSQSVTVPACQPLLSSYMRKGWDNDSTEVTKLQNFLNEYGFAVPVTGFFGDLTEEAVKAFQGKYLPDVLTPWGIDYSTGFVYKTTRHKINNLVCPGSEVMPTLP